MTSKEWEYFKLSEITNLITRGITPKYVDQNGLVVINQKCIRNGNISFADARFTDNISKKVPDNKLIRQNDILICSTGIGTLGRVGFFRNAIKTKATVDSHVTIVRANEEYVDYKYLGYNLFNRQQEIEALAQGSTGQTELSRVDLGELVILLPPIEIQQKIAKVLSSLDDKIELNNKINQNLEQQAQAIFNKFFENCQIENKVIGNYLTPKRGKNLLSKDAKHGDIPVIAGGLNPATYHNIANTMAPVITISASGANAGYVNLWHIPVWASDSSYIDSSINPYVYFWYVLLKKRQKEIYDSQTGSAQPHIYPKHIEKMSIFNLNIINVKKYNEHVKPLFETIGNNLSENKRLTQLRDTLLPKLMSGEIDVDKIGEHII